MSLNDVYTNRQIEVLKETINKDWFITLLHGAKRSGKTKINNDLFLFELRRVRKIADEENIKEPMYILAGVSSSTIQKNILQELYNTYDIEPKFDKHGNFKLFGVKVVQAYTGNIGGVGSIRGMTAYGAYINEASLAKQEVFAEIVSRCSATGARILADTNPDNPEHWLKKEYIDNSSKSIQSFHFGLDDNTFLSERYRTNIKASTPSGMFYDRDIKGLWVSADGVVYKDFDANKHYIDSSDLPPLAKYYCGVDWGYDHWGSIVVIGETEDGTAYLVEEHASQYEEIDYWVGIAKEIQARYGGRIPFYCDSARPEHVSRFVREGLNAINAFKARLSGVESVAKRFKTNRLYICRDKVKKFRDEIYQYIWNKKTGEPIKEFDDVLDSLRYAIYSNEVYSNTSLEERMDAAKFFFG
ncbi:PBSX family phage terminase large subunit [Enterococcus faecalis]|uniref:Terminase large subunit n=3 Tax=Phifelvirus FL1 TaxID=1633149 RepID=D2IYW1_9CAUD|nr:PBSX family phage terminase large subunit [Enterococcus faecalis]YP_003347496.1 terminase large subunit [Enterococcus phage phiFL1A]ACZ63799.1 terminase large subunit [Enterococcus phage phiFL1B]ACZ63868.1 terminase large subunit [Enterococcus phage phiFL1C]ACZ63738.1 terminase large subunit [Enterococcus phage phiFL1A]EOK49540.1 PBSX family phage terminase, large subunit [Enterococcus faecalis EnGen0061]MCE2535144.1 PBSX family phage terminase large subunit [Enterococcus faecalis]